MKKRSLIILLLLFSDYSMAFPDVDSIGANYPSLHSVQINCIVNYSPETKIYSYHYSGYNNADNLGSIWIINIDISKNSGSVSLDTFGLLFDRPYIEKRFRKDILRRGNTVIPTSAAKLPNNSWDASITIDSTISFDILSNYIKPNNSFSGLELHSKGLPGIRRIAIEPWFDELKLFPSSEDSTIEPFSLELEDSIRNSVVYHGFTLGPVAPRIHFSKIQWCDTLKYFTIQSHALHWISSLSIMTKYLNYLSTAQSLLIANNTSEAKSTLQKMLNEINIDSTNALSSEAYALLRFNIEYLLSQIPP